MGDFMRYVTRLMGVRAGGIRVDYPCMYRSEWAEDFTGFVIYFSDTKIGEAKELRFESSAALFDFLDVMEPYGYFHCNNGNGEPDALIVVVSGLAYRFLDHVDSVSFFDRKDCDIDLTDVKWQYSYVSRFFDKERSIGYAYFGNVGAGGLMKYAAMPLFDMICLTANSVKEDGFYMAIFPEVAGSDTSLLGQFVMRVDCCDFQAAQRMVAKAKALGVDNIVRSRLR